jgi:glutaminyl-peptide cyclotransferase
MPQRTTQSRRARRVFSFKAILCVLCGSALIVVISIAAYGQTTPKFDSSRAWEHLRQLVAIGPRPAGSPAIEQTRRYIKDQLAAIGLKTVDQAWDDETPLGRVHMVNLIATIPGASADRLAITGHYDTKLFREFRFVGASDGGSSAAFLIELARVLKARRNALTMEIVFLDGEEAVIEWRGTDHTYGSRHYVDVARRAKALATLKAMILVDMIADRDLGIRRDANSTKWLTDIVWSAAARLKLSNYFLPATTAVEDDHQPFIAAGVPSVDIIDLDYDAWHTRQDTLDAVSARSLQVVGDVLLAALPEIETHAVRPRR